MRKIKEVLRLKFELNLGQRQIARSCSIGVATVNEYLHRAAAAGVSWPLPEGWDDRRLETALYGDRSPATRPQKPEPDFAAVQKERQRPHVTRQLLWEEYRESNPDGYSYSRFCELYHRWCQKQDVVMR